MPLHRQYIMLYVGDKSAIEKFEEEIGVHCHKRRRCSKKICSVYDKKSKWQSLFTPDGLK